MVKIWYNKIVIIINKIGIVNLDLFITMNLHLAKAKKFICSISWAAYYYFFNNFFQFSFVTKKSLWEIPLSLYEEHKQHIWHHFADVIILTEQICQQGDIVF